MKIILVSVCNRCPYYVNDYNSSTTISKDLCKINRYKEIKNINAQLSVPKWCPLEDYK